MYELEKGEGNFYVGNKTLFLLSYYRSARKKSTARRIPSQIVYNRFFSHFSPLCHCFVVLFSAGPSIIMSAEETTERFLRAAAAAQFHRNGSKGRFYGIQPLLQCVFPLVRIIMKGDEIRQKGPIS